MFRVKFISSILIFGILFCIILSCRAESHRTAYDENIEKANGYENVNADSILFYATQAYFVAEKMHNPNLQLDAIVLIIKAQIKLGRYSFAILSCQKADSISNSNSSLKRGDEIMMYYGLVFSNAGFVSEALEKLLSAEEQMIESDENVFIGELYFYIALTYYNLNDYKQSRKYAKNAINAEQFLNNKHGLVKNYILLANSFNNIDSIQKYLSLTEELVNSKEMNFKKIALLNSKALLFKSIGESDKAKSLYNEAITISLTEGYKELLSNLYNNYAYLLMKEEKFDSVAIVLNTTLLLARELDNIDLEASILDTYSDYFINIDDSATSYKYYRNSIKLRNQYKDKQRIEQSMFLSTVFETEKKEIEIARQESKLYQINTILFALLALFSAAIAILFYFRQKSATRKVTIKTMEQDAKLEIANALIEGQDAERKRLAMDLHDGISPRIGMLKLSLDSSINKGENYPELIESLTEIGRSVRDMSHRMLPPQLESHGLVKALENMIHISERNSNINFIYYTNLKERLNYKLEVNLFYLSYEIINNSVKHSKGNEINIQLLTDHETISLSVEDDGVGFDTAFDYNGLGLKNIRQRVNYLDGKLTIDTNPGQGTAIIIEVKL